MFRSTWMIGPVLASALMILSIPAIPNVAYAQKSTLNATYQDNNFLALREASRRNDASKAADLAARLSDYPMPAYVDYYRLKPRIQTASANEVRDFLTRYDGMAIADRLRNDWLLELGHQRDWNTFDEQYPQFVLKDDNQLKCYALMSRALKRQSVIDEARLLLVTPKDYGVACNALIMTLLENGEFSRKDVWSQIRLAAENNAADPAQRMAQILAGENNTASDNNLVNKVMQAMTDPEKILTQEIGSSYASRQLYIIALGRAAKANPARAVNVLMEIEQRKKLTTQELGLAWAQIALQASLKLAPEAIDYWHRINDAPLSLEAYQWQVRIALRAGDWKLVQSGIAAMPLSLRNDATWIYWKGRALKQSGKSEEAREAHKLFLSIADQHNFYGQLALEELGQKTTIPTSAPAVTVPEIQVMANNPGLLRALKFFALGLRQEGIREWNWELRKMTEREHLAAAEFARQSDVLDRMVSTSDRTKTEVDFSQRFPTPYRDVLYKTTQTTGLEMAFVYGLIRQESRFILNARSSVGASGLMQLMPATAQHVAKKIGLRDFSVNQVNDISTNILLGSTYLNMMLTNLDGSQAMAAAGYNAGPRRPRAWQATLNQTVEGAIFAESIPFTETRNYVKNVLSNANYYSALFENKPQSLKARLGVVAPKELGLMP